MHYTTQEISSSMSTLGSKHVTMQSIFSQASPLLMQNSIPLAVKEYLMGQCIMCLCQNHKMYNRDDCQWQRVCTLNNPDTNNLLRMLKCCENALMQVCFL